MKERKTEVCTQESYTIWSVPQFQSND